MNQFLGCACVVLSALSTSIRAQQAAPAASTQPAAPGSSTSQPATRPATAPAGTQPASEGQKIVAPFEGITVIIHAASPHESRVELAAFTCLDAGWLEQIACAPATREHESLMVVKAKPSEVHAALLMAGFEPAGERIALSVRYADKDGAVQEHAVGKWIRGQSTPDKPGKPFPNEHWVFGGSTFARNTPDMGPGEH